MDDTSKPVGEPDPTLAITDRINVALIPAGVAALAHLRSSLGGAGRPASITDVVNKALGVYEQINRWDQAGAILLLQEPGREHLTRFRFL